MFLPLMGFLMFAALLTPFAAIALTSREEPPRLGDLTRFYVGAGLWPATLATLDFYLGSPLSAVPYLLLLLMTPLMGKLCLSRRPWSIPLLGLECLGAALWLAHLLVSPDPEWP